VSCPLNCALQGVIQQLLVADGCELYVRLPSLYLGRSALEQESLNWAEVQVRPSTTTSATASVLSVCAFESGATQLMYEHSARHLGDNNGS
jgi:hypothetical protein